MGARPLVILAVADHGEALGDHGEDSHGMLLYDPTVRVPLLLAGSGVPRGVDDDDPVSTVDVAPTLLELAGVAAPDAASLAGTSLVASVRDAAAGGGAAASRDAFAQRPLYYEALSAYFGYGWSPLFAVQVGRELLIEGPRPELYDVVADPDETKNLVDEHADVAERMRRSFERWRTEAAAGHASARPDPTPSSASEMVQLGYVSAFADVSIAVPEPGRVDAARRDPRDGAAIVKKIFEMQQLVQQKRHPAALRARAAADRRGPGQPDGAGAGRLAADPGRRRGARRSAPREGGATSPRPRAAPLARAGLRAARPARRRARAAREARCGAPGVPARAAAPGELLLEAGRKDDAARELEALLAAAPKADELRKRAQELLERARAH